MDQAGTVNRAKRLGHLPGDRTELPIGMPFQLKNPMKRRQHIGQPDSVERFLFDQQTERVERAYFVKVINRKHIFGV